MTRFENESVGSEPFDESEVNVIRGKSLMMPPEIGADVRKLCRMLDWFECQLDEADESDTFGSEGWRRHFGISE